MSALRQGEHRAVEAAQQAIASPLLEETSIEGARGLLINITGSEDVTLNEINEAAEIITEGADTEAQILFGAVVDPELGDHISVTVIATGFSRVPDGRSAAGDAGQIFSRDPVRGEHTGAHQPIPGSRRPELGVRHQPD